MEKIRLKPELDINDLLKIDPAVLEMIAFTADYCLQYNLPCTITSLMGDVPGRRTSTHSDGRSVDFSSKIWSDFHIARFQHEFKKRFRGNHKVPGGVAHFHMQVRRRDGDRKLS